MENRTQKFYSIPLLFQRFDHGAALKIERIMSHLNIAFDRYASIDTVMHSFHFGNKLPGTLDFGNAVFERCSAIC